jgi:branched-chain amino acid transport system ATP-binding protein
MLEVRRLDVTYGHLWAVRGLSLEVGEGQVVALLGANGAGKSSTLRAIAGLVAARGEMLFRGRLLHSLRADRRVGLGIATVPQGRELFRTLSVAENLMLGAYRRHDRRAERRDLSWIYDLFPVLAERRAMAAGALSGGQAQMLAIARALMAGPSLLLLDEPSEGLAPKLVDQLFRLLPHLQEERKLAMLLVEQNAHRALQVAGHAYVLENGAVALEGASAELARDPRIKRLYLGG